MTAYTMYEALRVHMALTDSEIRRVATRVAVLDPDTFMSAVAAMRRDDAQARRNHPSASPTAQMVNAQEDDA